MHPLPDTGLKRWRRLGDWLRRFWTRDALSELDERQRRDIGLRPQHRRPDAATLLDMSRPGEWRR